LLFADAIATNVIYGILKKCQNQNQETNQRKKNQRRKCPKKDDSEDELSPPICNMGRSIIPDTLECDMDLPDDDCIRQTLPPSPTRSVTPAYMKKAYSEIVGRNHETPENDISIYKENLARNLTLWLDEDVSTQIAQSLDKSPKQCLVGVQKDTRVKTKNKFTVVLKSDQLMDKVSYSVVTINGKRCYPKLPVAATPSLLVSAAEHAGIQPVEAIAQTAGESSVRFGGWILWTRPTSEEPDLLHFDGAEYAMIWKSKGQRKQLLEKEQPQQLQQQPQESREPQVEHETREEISHNSETTPKPTKQAPPPPP